MPSEGQVSQEYNLPGIESIASSTTGDLPGIKSIALCTTESYSLVILGQAYQHFFLRPWSPMLTPVWVCPDCVMERGGKFAACRVQLSL